MIDKTKEPKPFPKIVNYNGKVWKEFHVPVGDYHWLKISDQDDSVMISFRDESVNTKDILSFDLVKNATAYQAIIDIFTELKES